MKKTQQNNERAPFACFINYTSFNASRDHIFAISDSQLFKEPMPIQAEHRDPKKYCRFHQQTGHESTNCKHLKDETEDLIWRGHLGEFIER